MIYKIKKVLHNCSESLFEALSCFISILACDGPLVPIALIISARTVLSALVH
jgi:hypothetical protein